jgi:hypothetical protein
MMINNAAIGAINNADQVVEYLGHVDSWLRTNGAGGTPQELRNALVAQYNALTLAQVAPVNNGYVGQRGNYEVVDQDQAAEALAQANKIYDEVTSNTPLHIQATEVAPTAQSINDAALRIAQLSPTVSHVQNRKEMGSQAKGQRVRTLEEQMAQMGVNDDEDGDA